MDKWRMHVGLSDFQLVNNDIADNLKYFTNEKSSDYFKNYTVKYVNVFCTMSFDLLIHWKL